MQSGWIASRNTFLSPFSSAAYMRFTASLFSIAAIRFLLARSMVQDASYEKCIMRISIMPKTNRLRGKLDMLVLLDAILESANLTRAAGMLGLSQPALSRTLARLRVEFGDPLLVRVGGRMRLTPKAHSLREPLGRLLGDASDLFAPSSFDPKRESRIFKAIIPDVVAAPLLPRLLARLRDEAPLCRLDLKPWRSRGDQKFDLDFAITSESDEFVGYRMQKLFQDCDVLAFCGRRPKGDPLLLDHVAVVASGQEEDPVDSWLRKSKRKRRIVSVVPHYLLALQLVADAKLNAILPSRMIDALGPALGVQGMRMRVSQSSDQLWLLHPPHLERDPASGWLRRLVQSVCRWRDPASKQW